LIFQYFEVIFEGASDKDERLATITYTDDKVVCHGKPLYRRYKRWKVACACPDKLDFISGLS
jgi:hypothetical protein